MYCKYCGKDISDDSIFCKHCGKSVSEHEKGLFDGIDSQTNEQTIDKFVWSEDIENAQGSPSTNEEMNKVQKGLAVMQALSQFWKQLPKSGKIILVIVIVLVLSMISNCTKKIKRIVTGEPAPTEIAATEPEIYADSSIDTENPQTTEEATWDDVKESLGIDSEEKPEDKPFTPADYVAAPEYEELARYPDTYKDGMYKFYGKVIQVSEGVFNTAIRLELHDDINQVIYCEVPKELTENRRILEDDYVTMYGIYKGVTTYTTVLGAKITVPKITVTQYMY